MRTTMNTITAWTFARERCALPTIDFKGTKYLGGHGSTEHLTMPTAILEERLREWSVPESAKHEEESRLPCILCGVTDCHVEGGGEAYWATFRAGDGSTRLVHYCASGCRENGTVLLADGPHAGGFVVWRCACEAAACWPRGVRYPDTQEDVLAADLASSSTDCCGDACPNCNKPRGTYRWGLFD